MKNLFIILIVLVVVTSCDNGIRLLPDKIDLIKHKEYNVYFENLSIYSFDHKIDNPASLTSINFKCCTRNVVFNHWESIKALDNDERLNLINYLDECYQHDKVKEVKFLVDELRYSNNKNYFFAGCYKDKLDKFYYHRLLLDTANSKLYYFEYYD